MNQSSLPNLPEELEPYSDAIAQTIKPYLKIQATPQSTDWWQSKFGGFPYLPQGWEYPTNSQGQYLKFLAQLNFSEIPQLDNFPTQGILQFYIDGNDGYYGLDIDRPTEQNDFRVLYFPEVDRRIDRLVTDFVFLANSDFKVSPLTGEFALSFTPHTSPITPNNPYLEKYLPDFGDDLQDTYSYYFDEFDNLEGADHQVGGYPSFTQSDPRFDLPQDQEEYHLLLQIDTDYQTLDREHEICWGDGGIGNFFIQPSRLKALDFSNVLYHWDCS